MSQIGAKLPDPLDSASISVGGHRYVIRTDRHECRWSHFLVNVKDESDIDMIRQHVQLVADGYNTAQYSEVSLHAFYNAQLLETIQALFDEHEYLEIHSTPEKPQSQRKS